MGQIKKNGEEKTQTQEVTGNEAREGRRKEGVDMGLGVVVCILGLVLGTWGSEWEGPVEVMRYGDPEQFVPVQVLDGDSTTHYVWCNWTDGKVYYRRLWSNETSSPILKLSETTFCMEGLDLTVRGLRGIVLIAFEATRGRNLKQSCVPSTPTGCRDVYYVLSTDGGNSFLAPIAVPRKNMADIMNRWVEHALAALWQGRYWIFYFVMDPSKGAFSLCAVTLPPGSSAFSNEVTVLPMSSSYQFRGVFMTYGRPAKLHIFIENEKGEYLRSTSNDNGASWSNLTSMTGFCEQGDSKMGAFYDSMVLPNSIFSICTNVSGNYVYMKWSKDEGKSWGDRISTSLPFVTGSPILYSGHGNKPGIAVEHNKENGDYEYVLYQLTTGFSNVTMPVPANCTRANAFYPVADLKRKGIRLTVRDILRKNEYLAYSYFHSDPFS